MRHFEKICLENCPTQFKPVVNRRYVDGKVLFFPSNEHVETFKKHLSNQHKNIALASEIEKSSPLSFLNIKISRENNKFVI